MGGIEDEPDRSLAALTAEPHHRVRVVRPDDHRLHIPRSIVQAEHACAQHGPAVVAGDLVVVQVGGGEAGRGDLALHQAQSAAVHTTSLQPRSVLGGVGAGRRQHGGGIAEQGQVVGVVTRHPATPLVEVVDEEAQVEDVRLVGKDVVFEPAVEVQDVVVRDRPRAHDHWPNGNK